jgi:hypothetical protein
MKKVPLQTRTQPVKYQKCHYKAQLVGGANNHLEKYERQWEGLSHIFWKKHV